MQVLVLTQLTNNEPTALLVGENCTGYTRVATVDDYGVFLVAVAEEQIAALAQESLVENADWGQIIAPTTADALNGLLAAGGYTALSEELTLGQGMLAILGQFQPELYSVGEK
jgi:hypothetical protein